MLEKIHDEQMAKLETEKDIYNLGLINYVWKRVEAGSLMPQENIDLPSLLNTNWSLKEQIETTIETINLLKLIGLQSMVHEDFLKTLENHIKNIKALEPNILIKSRLDEIKQQISTDCQSYLNDEALEDALDKGKQSSSSSTGLSIRNLRFNIWSKYRNSADNFDCALPGSDEKSHNKHTLVTPLCFSSLPHPIASHALGY